MNTYSFGSNSGYIDELYRLYQENPDLVDSQWQNFFSTNGYQNGAGVVVTTEFSETDFRLQESVFRLINSYRRYGHLQAKINPLSEGIEERPFVYHLDINTYNFTPEQLQKEVLCYKFQNQESMKLASLIERLQRVYTGSIGFEYDYILDQEERYWIRDHIENRFVDNIQVDPDKQWHRIQTLIQAEVFEDQLHKNYIGQKRFSLEGGETIIPMLITIIENFASAEIREVVMGMAHRGRLNVLRNILNKPLQDIFYEFEDKSLFSDLGAGDVKYHMGFSSEYKDKNSNVVKLSLAPNPSHLQFVHPVVEGICRARQQINYFGNRQSVLPILLHGDAAFVGQGIVTETLNYSQVSGYNTGGSLHLIINNQIGFTTTPDEARSCIYASDFAKGIKAPVLHINAEDVDAACWAASFALEYRNKFGKDIVLDLYCFRKYGHNEGDDPNFTQPQLYNGIQKKNLISKTYAKKIVETAKFNEEEIENYRKLVSNEFKKEHSSLRDPKVMGEACPMYGRLRVNNINTAVDRENLKSLLRQMTTFPDTFTPYPKLQRILEARMEAFESGEGLDWGTAEGLAYASILADQVNVRLSGQDAGRGTFSHRHILINDNKTAEHYLTLQPVMDKYDSVFEVYNSTLSEAAVLAFEFGYSATDRKSLVIWEAQFGDFANGAQVIIDQFISSSEQKWDQLSGVVLLLPHGFEGQGPEHSSARLERFLQLCADGNMTVCYPTNAGQCFHLLRHQALSGIKRPLIVMTPKSMLRAKEAACSVDDLTTGRFQAVICNDFGVKKNKQRTKLVLTTGKVYYDLEKRLLEVKNPDVRVIRIEQLYPFPQFELKKLIKELNVTECAWLQEAPMNMGAWLYMEPYIRTKLNLNAHYFGRALSASPATGSYRRHSNEYNDYMNGVMQYLEK